MRRLDRRSQEDESRSLGLDEDSFRDDPAPADDAFERAHAELMELFGSPDTPCEGSEKAQTRVWRFRGASVKPPRGAGLIKKLQCIDPELVWTYAGGRLSCPASARVGEPLPIGTETVIDVEANDDDRPALASAPPLVEATGAVVRATPRRPGAPA